MTDLEIKKNVEAELNWEPSVNAAQIGVAVKDGVLTLSGRVDSYWEKVAAARAAVRVEGVRAVANELEIHLPFSSERTDEDIARAAVNGLEWSVSVPRDRIKVKVSKGWITLEGTVDWQFQKTAAEEAVRNLVGVKGVLNHIDVKPQVSSTEVKSAIEAALKRSVEGDAKRITVETAGDKVIPRGTGRSRLGREEAERRAVLARGVRRADNRVTIVPTAAAAA